MSTADVRPVSGRGRSGGGRGDTRLGLRSTGDSESLLSAVVPRSTGSGLGAPRSGGPGGAVRPGTTTHDDGTVDGTVDGATVDEEGRGCKTGSLCGSPPVTVEAPEGNGRTRR